MGVSVCLCEYQQQKSDISHKIGLSLGTYGRMTALASTIQSDLAELVSLACLLLSFCMSCSLEAKLAIRKLREKDFVNQLAPSCLLCLSVR